MSACLQADITEHAVVTNVEARTGVSGSKVGCSRSEPQTFPLGLENVTVTRLVIWLCKCALITKVE